MEESRETRVGPSSLSCNSVLTLGGRVSAGTTLAVLAVAGVGAGLVLGWDSLVALGLSSFVLALLPCAAMCAFGLCAHRITRKDAGAVRAPVPPSEPQPPTAGTAAVAAETGGLDTPGTGAPAPVEDSAAR